MESQLTFVTLRLLNIDHHRAYKLQIPTLVVKYSRHLISRPSQSPGRSGSGCRISISLYSQAGRGVLCCDLFSLHSNES